MKNLLKKHSLLIITAVYGVIYLSWFRYLEQGVDMPIHIIHSVIDDYIPFLEIFVVPYFCWFAFVAVFGAYFYFKDKRDFAKLMINLMVGMTVFLIVSSLYPNGQDLRPELMPRDNIFTRLVEFLYTMDTPTNILPSIHVYNTLGIYNAVKNSPHFRDKELLRGATLVMTVLIIASTVFIKQHTIIDVMAAFVIEVPVYLLLYKTEGAWKRNFENKLLKEFY